MKSEGGVKGENCWVGVPPTAACDPHAQGLPTSFRELTPRWARATAQPPLIGGHFAQKWDTDVREIAVTLM